MKKLICVLMGCLMLLSLLPLAACGSQKDIATGTLAPKETRPAPATDPLTDPATDPTTEPVTQPATEPVTDVPEEFTDANETVEVISNALKVRSSADTSSEKNVIAYITAGATFHCTGYSQNWCRIEYEGKTAYVGIKHVKTVTDGAETNPI